MLQVWDKVKTECRRERESRSHEVSKYRSRLYLLRHHKRHTEAQQAQTQEGKYRQWTLYTSGLHSTKVRPHNLPHFLHKYTDFSIFSLPNFIFSTFKGVRETHRARKERRLWGKREKNSCSYQKVIHVCVGVLSCAASLHPDKDTHTHTNTISFTGSRPNYDLL